MSKNQKKDTDKAQLELIEKDAMLEKVTGGNVSQSGMCPNGVTKADFPKRGSDFCYMSMRAMITETCENMITNSCKCKKMGWIGAFNFPSG